MTQSRKQRTQGTKKQKIPNMVLVTITDSKEGRHIEVSTTGNIRQTEAPTLLKLAATVAEKQLGLE